MPPSWLVTGGSSGIGLSIGRMLLQKGGTPILTTRDVAKARVAAPDIESKGGKWLELDFADDKLEDTVRDTVVKEEIDVVVNNAAYSLVGAVEECSPELIRTQYETNLIGPIRIIQAAVPVFRQRRNGTIINIGSSVSYSGVPGIGIYGSTKAALRTVTESLTLELASFGIRVLLFEPGRFRTNFGKGGVFAVSGEHGFGEAYKGTAVQHVFNMLRSSPPAPGDPDAAAQRIYELVTGSGMAEGDGVKDLARITLGSDAVEGLEKTGTAWVELAGKIGDISRSTDFQEKEGSSYLSW